MLNAQSKFALSKKLKNKLHLTLGHLVNYLLKKNIEFIPIKKTKAKEGEKRNMLQKFFHIKCFESIVKEDDK